MRRQYRLSSAQRYHWDLTRHGEHAPDINIVLTVFLGEQDDLAAAGTRLRAAVGRHAVLRTLYSDPDGEPLQVFDEGHEIPVTTIDADAAQRPDMAAPEVPVDFIAWFAVRGAGAAMARAVAAAVDGHKAHRYDLTRELPSRITMVADRNGLATAVLGFHHAAIDAHALSVLLADLRAALSDGAYRPVLDLRYLEYAEMQARSYSERRSRQIAYWTHLLHDPAKESGDSLLDRRPRPCRVESRVLAHAEVWTEDSARGKPLPPARHLMALAQGLGAAGLMSGSHILGTTSNRVTADAQDIIGCFYKHVIWSLPQSGLGDPSATARHLAVQGLRSYQNIDVSLADILGEYRALHGLYPALNASITYRDLRPLQTIAGSNRVEAAPFLSNRIEDRIPIHMHVSLERDQLSASLVYDPEVIDEETARLVSNRVAQAYLTGS